MSCERFKTRLADFALGAEDPELGAHLNSCASCRAELETQRALLASIDRGVASMVSTKPSGDFAAHVRRRIAQESAAPRPWFSGWVSVTAAALALIVLVTFWMIRRGPAVPELANRKPPTQTARPSREPQVAKEAPLVAAPPHATGLRTIRPPREPQSAAIREPEVLVPPGQMAAVISLYNFVWSGKADGASLVAAAVPASDLLKPWTTDELKITPLEIAPLMEEGKPKGSLENR